MRGKRHTRRGFTIVEALVSIAVSIIIVLGMGAVMINMFGSIRDSTDFAEATGRVDLIRRLTFDARTGDQLIFPATDGASGAYTDGGNEGHQVQFRALYYDPNTDETTEQIITWESVRSSNAPEGTPFVVRRWVDDGTGADLTFGESNINHFEIERQSETNFSAEFETEEDGQVAAVSLSVTLRNVR